MITAEKAAFVYPFVISLFYLAMANRFRWMLSTATISFAFTALIIFAGSFYQKLQVAEFVGWYLGVRTLLTPGALVVHYSDYFREHGFTFGTHITGVGYLVPTPQHYLADKRWPSIGHFVGEDFLGIEKLNANANFIAWDGIASLGLVGIAIAFIALLAFLFLLDRSTSGIRSSISVPLLVPLSLTLTNGSLFTSLTSFGGIALLVVFGSMFVCASPSDGVEEDWDNELCESDQ
jgi:hypothetical protein